MRERQIAAADVALLIGARPPASKAFGTMTVERGDAGIRWHVTAAGADTTLGRLGFEEGDRIESINGFSLDNLSRLASADMLQALVERRGATTCIALDVTR